MTVPTRAVLDRWATPRVALAALAVAVACIAGLVWRQDRLGGLALLDSRTWYTPDEAAALFEALDRLDAGARTVYAATGLTIDMAFPAGLRTAVRDPAAPPVPGAVLPAAARDGGGGRAGERDRRGAGAELRRRAVAACVAGRGVHPGQGALRLRRAGGDMRRRRPLAVAAPAALTGLCIPQTNRAVWNVAEPVSRPKPPPWRSTCAFLVNPAGATRPASGSRSATGVPLRGAASGTARARPATRPSGRASSPAGNPYRR